MNTETAQVEHIESGDSIEVRFKAGWCDGWKLVGIKSTGDGRRAIVERIEDGATLNAISPDRIRKI